MQATRKGPTVTEATGEEAELLITIICLPTMKAVCLASGLDRAHRLTSGWICETMCSTTGPETDVTVERA